MPRRLIYRCKKLT